MNEKLRWIAQNFGLIQGGIGFAVLAIAYSLLSNKNQSQFRAREADRKDRPKDARIKPGQDALANAKLNVKKPLQLTGIRIDGKPYEILGVRPNATPDEIRLAYKNLMMQYHPDRIGPAGSQQWNDAQQIAAALNEAKQAMLKGGK